MRTIERRRGRKIAARGVYRDPVRSSKEFFVRNQWVALDLLDALDADSMGLAGMGFALFDRLGIIGTLSPGAQHAAQNDHRLGLADDRASFSLDTKPTLGRGC